MNNMNLRLRPYDLLLKTLVAIATTFIAVTSLAEVDRSDIVEDLREPVSDIVEMRIPLEVNSPYKQRRETHGFLVGLNFENTEMFNYVSIIDFATPYYDMFGVTEIPIYNLQMSYKYNFSLGALSVNTGIGYGTFSSQVSGSIRTLEITKYMLSASYIADGLFDEPYVAPYVTFGMNQFGITEKNGEESFSTGIEAAYFYTAGVLIQLNWLDHEAATRALIEYGLENSYLDVFVTQFQPSLDPGDPNTETEYTLGAGVRLEF